MSQQSHSDTRQHRRLTAGDAEQGGLLEAVS